MIEKLKQIDTVRILGNPVFIIGAVIFLYSPSMFNHLPIVSTYDAYIKLFFVAIIFGCYLVRVLNGKKIDSIFVLLNLFSAYQFVVTVVNKGDVAGAIWLYWILSDAIFLFIDMEMDDGDKALKYICYIFFAMMVINLYTVIKLPYIYNYIPDMSSVYWFGNYNTFINWYLPEIFVAYYVINKNDNDKYKILLILSICIVCVTYYFARSLTSIAVLSFFVIYLLFFNREIYQKILNQRTYFFILLVIFFLFVLSRIGENMFSDILALFNKDITLSGRMEIWEDSIRIILKNPIWGYGVYTNNARALHGYVHSHNLILEIIFRTGLIGFIIYILSWKRIWGNIEKTENIKIKGFIAAAFFVFWMRAQFETGNQLFLILMMALLWKVSSTEKIKI